MKRLFFSVMALAGVLAVTSMNNIERRTVQEEGTPVKWLTLEEAMKKAQTDKRPIFIDVYTDWCGWCKVMDKETFSDPKVAELLNDKFYPVKFDGEQKEDVVFKGNTYKYVVNGRSGYHELAAAMLNNQLSYPTVVFLDEEFNMIQPLAGYRKAKEFHMIAQYIGEGHFKKGVKWNDWQNLYKSPY
jgi:thioredoxin-related protein